MFLYGSDGAAECLADRGDAGPDRRRRMVWADVAGKRDPLNDTIDRLYGLPVDEFTPARDAAAKERRGEGDREGAEVLKRLRKPNLVAWSLNRVRRAEPGVVDELLNAGERLQEAQRKLVSGGERGLLRDAAADERALVGRVADLAAAELRTVGHAANADTLSKLFATLHAAASNDDVRARVANGRLISDHELSDLGLGDSGALVATAPRATPRRKQTSGDPGRTQARARKRDPSRQRPRAPKRDPSRQQARVPKREREQRMAPAGAPASTRQARALADRLERARARHAEQAERADQARERADEAGRAAREAADELGRAETAAREAATAAKQATAAAEQAGTTAKRATTTARKATSTAEKAAGAADRATESERRAADAVRELEADLAALADDA